MEKFQRFGTNQPDSNESPLVSIDFPTKLEKEGNPYFQKDMKKLTDKVTFSTTEDSELANLIATDSTDSMQRGYEIYPASYGVSVGIAQRSPLKEVSSNKYTTQFELGRVKYTIRHERI